MLEGWEEESSDILGRKGMQRAMAPVQAEGAQQHTLGTARKGPSGPKQFQGSYCFVFFRALFILNAAMHQHMVF